MDADLINFEANFSVLDRYGTYITNEEYITDPAIGRDQQIKELILVLLTPEKSAILIGKPGIGKTAIVEGLAYRIQKDDVPEALKGYEIINIKTASLLGTMPSGESKVQKMIDELKTKDKLILFIDEIHMLIGATDSSSLDFANIFKEGLGRGSIKVIGATTTEEYERYILRDKAFTRRFQKIDVPEPSKEETVKIMMGTLPKFEKQTGRKMKYTPFIQERIMTFLVDITSEYKRIFALGSRYPDVCLTLLKQAFSYAVYDDRQYMDIFDIRKAVENSKNIYPDVIKKELPNFDKIFNDIILEEKGEKPVEEWRKDYQGLNERHNNESKILKENEDKLSILENAPEIIDRQELKDNKPLQSILTSKGKKKYAKVGATSVSKGLKEKINRSENAKELDDILLSNDVEILNKRKSTEPNLPKEYVVTEEIKQGVSDSFLLGKPIGSTLNKKVKEENRIDTYKTDNQKKRKKNEGKNMWDNGNYRPERQDINSQNFDKYNNYFHQENNYQNNGYNQQMNNGYGNQTNPNEAMENQRRMDMLMGRPNSNMNPMMNQEIPSQGNMMGPMNQGMMPPNNMMGPMNQGMIPPNNMMGPMNQGMMPPNNMMGPMNQGMPPQNNMMDSNVNSAVQGLPNENNLSEDEKSDPLESLFGAPMYSSNEPEDKFDDIPEIYSPISNNSNFNNQMNNYMNSNSSFGIPQKKSENEYTGETLFGAPMYSGEQSNTTNEEPNNNSVDIFGQLITDNMRIKNGKIVDEFPTFDKINNLSNIKTVINDVRDVKDDNSGLIPNLETGSIMKQELGMNQGMMSPNNMMGPMNQGMMPQNNMMGPMNQGMMPPNNMMGPMNQGMMPPNNMMGPMNQGIMPQNNMMRPMNQGMMPPNNMMGPMNQGMMPSNNMMGPMNQGFGINQNRNWTYIDNGQNYNQMGVQPQQTFQTNILDAVPKVKEDNNISMTPNNATPTNNKDYYEDMKSGDFVNMSDIKNGQVKEEDSNKYMGVQTEENKPQYDLNLESNSNEEEFDDFFE